MSKRLIQYMVTHRGLPSYTQPTLVSFCRWFHYRQTDMNCFTFHFQSVSSGIASRCGRRFSTLSEKVISSDEDLKLRSFESHGVDPRICNKLETEFGITFATPAQTVLIDSWREGREIILNETTGSGKTFAMTVVLLSQALCDFKTHSQTKGLLIVPNRELALQVGNWCHRLLQDIPTEEVEKIIQVIFRDSGLNTQQEELLNKKKPSLIIGTPTRILELVKNETIELKHIQALVLDEIDHLLRLPTKNAPLNRVKNREIHPKPTASILERIFLNTRPQLLVMSATLNRSVRFYFRQMEWMTRPVYIDGTQGDHAKPPSTLEHMCVVVSKHSVFNLPFDNKTTFQTDRNVEETVSELNFEVSELKIETNSEVVGEETIPKFGNKNLEQEQDSLDDDDERLFECVGVAAHADEVKLGLLFVPNKVVVTPVLATLQKFGIDAHSLSDYFHSSKSNSHFSLPIQQPGTPRILVASYFNARGIDIPEATHIYIVGFPGSPRDYLHVAGRAGRLSGLKSLSGALLSEEGNSKESFTPTSGRVVTFLPNGAHRPARMCHLYRFISVTPVPYPHIE